MLISCKYSVSCPRNKVKFGKWPIIVNYNCNFVLKVLQRGKYVLVFCSTVQSPFDCLVLEVSNASRFENRICIPSQEKEKKIYIANEEIGASTVDSR